MKKTPQLEVLPFPSLGPFLGANSMAWCYLVWGKKDGEQENTRSSPSMFMFVELCHVSAFPYALFIKMCFASIGDVIRAVDQKSCYSRPRIRKYMEERIPIQKRK